ncbi:hypothetical protein [Phytohabitans houttuyneae]|uniref:MalT-like TPR region domain-containing protein n=1 Tax=Phytohabitans houttuyneae TaxID=1076126 RepID=A0A6V8KU96_9ACTN|nr:hypothetical protein [Phytohabitans houttuyneae]GFJ85889.1 hypothetical protein Phou_100690 [Phytohabitans houttuyneae]
MEVQAGRRRTGETWLARAAALAETDAELAAILGVRGMNASDRGDYPTALAQLGESAERAASAGDQRQQAWSLSVLARAHVLRGERSQATAALDLSLALIHEQRWMAFLPWPQALHAELDLAAGHADAAADTLERAWTLALQVDDPCWEGMAARGLGRLHAARGDRAGAAQWMGEARRRCSAVPDRYQWVHGYVLDAAAATAIEHGERERAEALVGSLSSLAARCDLGELVVRAHLHRHRLGDPNALGSARLLAAGIENPALAEMLSG